MNALYVGRYSPAQTGVPGPVWREVEEGAWIWLFGAQCLGVALPFKLQVATQLLANYMYNLSTQMAAKVVLPTKRCTMCLLAMYMKVLYRS